MRCLVSMFRVNVLTVFFSSLCFTYHMENEKEEETKIKFIETTKYFRSLQINLIMFREQQQQQQNGK